MKYLNICAMMLMVSVLLMSCTENFDCDNYDVKEGEVTLNGEKMYPVAGTLLTNIALFGVRSVGWVVRVVEDDCVLSNTVIVNIGIAETDAIEGTFTFDVGSDVQGQFSYDQEEDGTGGTTLAIESGTIEVTEKSDGVYELDIDAVLSDGETATMTTEYKFQ